MSGTVRSAAVTGLAFLAASCVKPGHIEQNRPEHTMSFTGSYEFMTSCVQNRLGAKVQEQPDRTVVYGAAKSRQVDGFTHYAITLRRTGPGEGIAMLRVQRVLTHGTSTTAIAPPKLSEAALYEYWFPVEECARRAKGE